MFNVILNHQSSSKEDVFDSTWKDFSWKSGWGGSNSERSVAAALKGNLLVETNPSICTFSSNWRYFMETVKVKAI